MSDDYDEQLDAWFDQQRKNGMAVLPRDEWRAKLDDAESIGYGKGRADERDEAKPLHDEMLKALRSLYSWMPNVKTFERMGFDGKGPARALADARAVIGKATGTYK
jgi:hypothetical protein